MIKYKKFTWGNWFIKRIHYICLILEEDYDGWYRTWYMIRLPEILHELCKHFRSSSKGNNNIYYWPGDVNSFTLHFHQGSKWAKQCDMPVFHIFCLLVEQFILCPFVSLSAIITLRTINRKNWLIHGFETQWQNPTTSWMTYTFCGICQHSG